MIFIPLTLGLLFSVNAHSAPFCPSFADLKMNVSGCDDNFALGKKADACLSLFTNEVNAGKAQMEAILKGGGSGKMEQSASYSSATSVFDRTVKQLDNVIANGEAAKLAVSSYSDNLSLPEDYDQPAFIGMSTEKYLSVEPCYATPKRVISEDAAILTLMVEDLKKTRAEVVTKGGITQSQSGQMNSANTQNLKTENAPGTPSLPKASSAKNRDSDVSGIKEDQKKRELKK